MAQEYSGNIQIAGLTLETNPESYKKEYMKMGSFARTVGGNLVGQDVSERKYKFRISNVTQSEVESIKMRAAADINIELIDWVPIAERESISRSYQELLETSMINGETVYRYIPIYTVAIMKYTETYKGNTVSYVIEAEEQ